MLQSIREKTKGWIAYVIIGLISIPFLLAGITSYFGAGALPPAAIVDGEEISSRQLDFAYRGYQQRLRSLFGGKIPEAFDNEAVLKEQARDQLIDEQVLSAYVANNKFRLGDQALNKKITSMDIFHEDGRFSSELYQGQLRSQGVSAPQFEEDIRRSEEMLQVRSGINTTSITSATREDEQQSLSNQLRHVSSLVLPINIDSVEITDADLEKEYKVNANRYMTSEKIKIDYIELNIETVMSSISLTENDIRDYYEQVKEDLIATEIREASHILLQLDDDASSELVEEKKALAMSLKQQIDSGVSFSSLAKEHSQDPGSASEGGDLGEVEKGMMVAPFEDALYDLYVGEVSEPVRSSFGWHIIKLTAKSGGEAPTYESMRLELSAQLKTEMAENKIYELAESLANLTYELADSLVPASEQLELTIKTSDWFERNSGVGIASNSKVRDLAFSTPVLKEGRNSEALELGDNHLLVIHLNEFQPSALPPLSEIKNTLIDSLKGQKARFLTVERGRQGLENAKANGLYSVATDWQQDVKDNGFIKRNSTVDQRDIVNLAFKMVKPTGASSFQGIELITGDYAIVEVSDVKVDVASMNDQKSNEPAEGSYEYQAWLKHKVSDAKVIRTPLSELQ